MARTGGAGTPDPARATRTCKGKSGDAGAGQSGIAITWHVDGWDWRRGAAGCSRSPDALRAK
ncbi:hypothetical protein ERN12_16805 [Rhodobacteraceae bacterium]|nr:hypothetical protein ERN12_16805 [Paracoccaceae bacterium]